ncbi:MAG TPA: hypothetical protein VG737_09425 [Cyclobacteriaceae bacterium]|nr:hypothetical protein [Cyclobacteriaceae bacterium]
MKKKSKKKEAKKPGYAPKPESPPRQDDEKPFDFGGLPERDLKKNLGCG